MSTRHQGELIVISGPSRGCRFQLSMDSMRLGRDQICEIHLEDEAASRTHSEIIKHGNQYFLRDLKSTNGTFCNDARITEIELVNGDRICVGDSMLQLELTQPTETNAPHIVFSQEDPVEQVRLSLNLDNAEFLEFADGKVPIESRRDLTRLFDFLNGVDGVLHVPALLDRALRLFFKAFPASRGIIMLMTPEGVPGLQTARALPELTGSQTMTVTHPMLHILLQQRESFLAVPAPENVSETIQIKPLGSMTEAERSRVVSSLGAPLRVKDKVVGIALLESLTPQVLFCEADLKLFSVMALKLAVSLENARQFSELLNFTEFNTAVMRAIGSGILITDTKCRVQYMNRAAQDITDRRDSSMIGRPLAEFPDMADFHQAVQNTLTFPRGRSLIVNGAENFAPSK